MSSPTSLEEIFDKLIEIKPHTQKLKIVIKTALEELAIIKTSNKKSRKNSNGNIIARKKAKQKQSKKNNKRHREIKIKVKRDGNNENTKYISKYVCRRNKRNPYQIWKKI